MIANYRTYLLVPIARYLCLQKGEEKTPHKTFSLLPRQLIPYRKHGLDLVTETLRSLHQENLSFDQTKEAISIKGQDEAIELQDYQLHDFGQIFEQASAKISTNLELADLFRQQEAYNPIAAVLDFIDNYQTPNYLTGTSAEKLALDFFFTYQKGHYFQRHFLFGTPSQKRGP
ncbi:MAG: hypothetical protein QME81_19490 [bacterium]|nr:hypothetical protein [bacterium]